MCVTDKYNNHMILYEDGSIDFTPHGESTIMTNMKFIGKMLKEKIEQIGYAAIAEESFGEGND